MTRRLLIIEPDAATRTLMRHVLTAAGFTIEEFESAHHARLLLDDQAFDLAIVDEFAGNGSALDEIRFLRKRYPRLGVVATGTVLSRRDVVELLRMDVCDALVKPFTPTELRESVARSFAHSMFAHLDSLEYAAAIDAVCDAFSRGTPEEAARSLVRAYSSAPLDAEVASLEALRAELEGRDDDAQRGYRAALALRHEESTRPPDPYEGLARLDAYHVATPVPTLRDEFANAPKWIVTNPTIDLKEQPPGNPGGPLVIVMTLALSTRDVPAIYLRQTAERAFALITTDTRSERLAPALWRLGTGPILAKSTSGIDVARLTQLRDKPMRPSRPTPQPTAKTSP